MLDDRLIGEPSTGHSRTLASLQRPQRGHSPRKSVGETGVASRTSPERRRRKRKAREKTATLAAHCSLGPDESGGTTGATLADAVQGVGASRDLCGTQKLADHPAVLELSDWGGRGLSADTSNRHAAEHRWSGQAPDRALPGARFGPVRAVARGGTGRRPRGLDAILRRGAGRPVDPGAGNGRHESPGPGGRVGPGEDSPDDPRCPA